VSNDGDDEDYKIGYGKPPIGAKWPKGVSGNPSGRPKKTPDFESQLLRELNSKLKINENGKRISVTKFELVAKQLVNKAAGGSVSTARLLLPYYQQAVERRAEEQRLSPINLRNLDVEDLTNEELIAVIQSGAEKADRAKLEKSIRAELRKSMKPELEKSIRADLEKSIRPELEKSIRREVKESVGAETNGRKRSNPRKIAPGRAVRTQELHFLKPIEGEVDDG
jgi:hypothetical protein